MAQHMAKSMTVFDELWTNVLPSISEEQSQEVRERMEGWCEVSQMWRNQHIETLFPSAIELIRGYACDANEQEPTLPLEAVQTHS